MKVIHSNQEKKTGIPEEEKSALYDILKELPKPDAKMKLTASQKYWWYWFGAEFVKTKQFTALDLMHLQDAAVAMDMKCKLVKIINDKNRNSKDGVGGVVQRFPSGATNITGYQSALKDEIKILEKISAYFGLSFLDRKKLGEINNADDSQLSLFEQMEKDLHQQV